MNSSNGPVEPRCSGRPSGTARISPTAHYTGFTWLAHGLSHPAFATASGRFMYRALSPANRALALAGQANLDGYLLGRHRLVDGLLREAITDGGVGQVIEIACGLSPRGYRFAREFGNSLTYIEADLPAMAARKRELLARAGASSPHHSVVAIDATAADGPLSLAHIVRELDPTRGLAIVTEGLVNYFAPNAVLPMWRRFAEILAQFSQGMYLSDLSVGADVGPLERLFAGVLGVFVRGKIHFHFADEAAAGRELRACGFSQVRMCTPDRYPDLTGPFDTHSSRLVRILDARVTPANQVSS